MLLRHLVRCWRLVGLLIVTESIILQIANGFESGTKAGTWEPVAGPLGKFIDGFVRNAEDASFSDLDGCAEISRQSISGGSPNKEEVTINYLVYSHRFHVSDYDGCPMSIETLHIKYTPHPDREPSGKPKILLGIVDLEGKSRSSKLDPALVSKHFVSFHEEEITQSGIIPLFGIFSANSSYALAVKAVNMCGNLRFPGIGIRLSPVKCSSTTSMYAVFPETCRAENGNSLEVQGKCVANAELLSPHKKPYAWCTKLGDYFLEQTTPVCGCSAGFEPMLGSPSTCQKCAGNYFKETAGNAPCVTCPPNSDPIQGVASACKCRNNHYWVKGQVGKSACFQPHIPEDISLDYEFTWINVSIARKEFQNRPQDQFAVYIYKSLSRAELPIETRSLTFDRPSVFISGLPHNTILTLYVCDGKDLDYDIESHGSRSFLDWRGIACSRHEFHTKSELRISNLKIEVPVTARTPKLILKWDAPLSLSALGSKFKYLVDVKHNDMVIWKSTIDSRQTAVEFPVTEMSGTYRADVKLVVREAQVFELSSNTISISNDLEKGAMSTLLVGVVGFILIILFIVFLMAVVFLKSRRGNIYPPPIGGSTKASVNMYDYGPLATVAGMAFPYSDKWSSMPGFEPSFARFMEPEAELVPYLESQGKPPNEMFMMLEVPKIDLDELETDKVEDCHRYFCKGEIAVCKVRMKDNFEEKFDLKVARSPSDANNRALLMEAATLAQLKHNHVVLLHGIVEYGSNAHCVALLLEDCGLQSLQEFCSWQSSAVGAQQPAGIIEKLQHLRCVASALEHFSQLQYVHKVLRTDNILINQNGVCRVAGFEDRVQFDANPEDVYQRYLRFWPPEVVKGRVFSLGTDIWSFGVVIWQCFNPNSFPFMQHTDAQVEKLVCEGHYLPPNPSDTMPPKLGELMKSCFAYSSLHRPTAFDLKEIIHSILFPSKAPDCIYTTESDIQLFLEQQNMLQYLDLFHVSGLDRMDQVNWNETFLKGIGIQDKKHRRRLVSEATKCVREKAKAMSFV